MLLIQAAPKQSAAVLTSENEAGQDENIPGYSYTTLNLEFHAFKWCRHL